MRWKFTKKRASQIHKQYTEPRKINYEKLKYLTWTHHSIALLWCLFDWYNVTTDEILAVFREDTANLGLDLNCLYRVQKSTILTSKGPSLYVHIKNRKIKILEFHCSVSQRGYLQAVFRLRLGFRQYIAKICLASNRCSQRSPVENIEDKKIYCLPNHNWIVHLVVTTLTFKHSQRHNKNCFSVTMARKSKPTTKETTMPLIKNWYLFNCLTMEVMAENTTAIC